MKTTFFKIVTMMLLAMGSFFSCEKKGNSANEESAHIIGIWKLIKVTIPFTGESNDYSAYNIVHEFKANGILTVSEVPEQIELYRGFESGDHHYSIIEDDDETTKHDGRSLEIDNTCFWHSVSSKGLEISNAPLDGTIYYLVKIN